MALPRAWIDPQLGCEELTSTRGAYMASTHLSCGVLSFDYKVRLQGWGGGKEEG